MNHTVIAVVDPFSSGAFLVEELARRNIPCVGVRALRDERHPLPPYPPATFVEFIEHHSLERTLDRLKARGVTAVIAGCEPAVELTDLLASRLGLRGNAPEHSAARRNKHDMQQAMWDAGLDHIEQIRTADLAAALAWAHARNRWPVVVKPLCSAGTDGVRICADAAGVAAAFNNILGQRNIYGATNTEVLVQAHVAGTEYVVDAVLRDGAMVVAAIWQYAKQPAGQDAGTGSPVYRHIELLSFEGVRQAALVACATEVLKALGICNGPVHVELMWADENDRPVLIEAAARMHGGLGAVIAELVCDTNQMDLTIDAYMAGEWFPREGIRGYRSHGHLVEFFLISRHEGPVVRCALDELLPTLQSHWTHRIWLRDAQLKRTHDLWSCPGIVVLHHAERSVIARDMEQIVEWENAGRLFELGATGQVQA